VPHLLLNHGHRNAGHERIDHMAVPEDMGRDLLSGELLPGRNLLDPDLFCQPVYGPGNRPILQRKSLYDYIQQIAQEGKYTMGKKFLIFLWMIIISIVVIYGHGQTATADCNSIIYRDGKSAACIDAEVSDNTLNLKIYPQEGWGVPNRASLIEMQGLKLKPVPVGNIRLGYDEDISVFLKDASIWYNYDGKGSYPANDKVSELPSFVAPLMVDLMTCGHLNVIGLPFLGKLGWIPMGTLWEEFSFKEFDDLSTLPVNPQFSDNNNYDNCMIVWPDQPMKLKGELLDSAFLDYPNYISIRIPLGTDKESNDKYIYIYVKLLLSKLTDLSYVCKYASCEFKIPLIKTTTDVIFPDPNLETAIREAIDKPKGAIYVTDLEELKIFIANNRDIKDLTGLEYCSNLEELALVSNQITDLSPISGTISLRQLGVNCNQIKDLSPLSGLTNLEFLLLGGNQITDLSPLSYLKHLYFLGITSNDIADLSPLSSITNLETLHMGSNPITDVTSLSGLKQLTLITKSSDQIIDLSPLSGLANLEIRTQPQKAC
jgi:hypothetical protein